MEKTSDGEKTEVAIPSTFYDFTQNTTFHGVKYIFEGKARIRK